MTFFQPHSQFLQHRPQARQAHFDPVILPQPQLQLCQGQIRLLPDPAGQPFPQLRGELTRGTSLGPPRALNLAGLTQLAHQLLRPSLAHAEAQSEHRDTVVTALVGFERTYGANRPNMGWPSVCGGNNQTAVYYLRTCSSAFASIRQPAGKRG